LVNTRTEHLQRLTRGMDDHDEVVVSPDGKTLAVTRYQRGDDLAGVVLETGVLHTLLAPPRPEREAQWTRDGQRYVYVTDPNGYGQVWMRNQADGSARPLFTEKSPGGPWPITDVRLSPDSDRLAMEMTGSEHNILIWKIGAGLPVR